jgi:hypothetical protein
LAAVELAIKQRHPEIVNAMFQSAPDGVPEEEWQRLRKEMRIEEAGQVQLIYDYSVRLTAQEKEEIIASRADHYK